MGSLAFIPHNAHRVDVDGRAMLMHVPTTSLFEMDEVEGVDIDTDVDLRITDAFLLTQERRHYETTERAKDDA